MDLLPAVLARLEEAARILDAPVVQHLVAVAREHASARTLRILVVGSTGSGRFSLVNALLEKGELLPATPRPKAPIPVIVTHGEGSTAELLATGGLRSTIPGERLRAFLTDPDTDATSYESITVHATAEILRTSELRVETVGGGRSPDAWREVLAATDYVFLVLRAPAVLSGPEKAFVRDILQPAFGLERVAIVLNQIHRVPEDERPAVAALVRAFLGPFEIQPLLVEFSAAWTGTSTEASRETYGHALVELVRRDLVERHRELRKTATRQAIANCLAEIRRELVRQKALIKTEASDLQHLRDTLGAQTDWLRERIDRAQRRIDFVVQTLLEEQILREIEGFGTALREQLPAEVMAAKEVAAVKTHLSGYLESLWSSFLRNEFDMRRAWLVAELEEIAGAVERDLVEIAREGNVDLSVAGAGADLASGLRSFLLSRRPDHDATTVASWLQVGGVLLLLVSPPVGVVSFVVGEVLRRLSAKDADIADRKAIIAAAVEAIRDLERQAAHLVETQCNELAERLRGAVADLYSQGAAQLRTAVEAEVRRREDVATRQENLDHLEEIVLPAIHALVQQPGD